MSGADVHIRLSPDQLEVLDEKAELEDRSRSNMARVLLFRALREAENLRNRFPQPRGW
jgi:hypothetical protein